MRHGQAAMEFIMTYGWAILVLLAGLSALAYFGVFSDRPQTERCMFTTGLNCKEFVINKLGASSNLTLIIQNNIGEPITIDAMNITSDSQTGNCNPINVDIKTDSTQRFDCQFNMFSAKTVKFSSIITYKKVQGDYNHTITGDIVVNNQ